MTSWIQIGLLIGGGLVLLSVLTAFLFVCYWLLKKMGFFNFAKRMILNTQRKKLLKDDNLLAFCYNRAESGLTENQVRSELMLSNKYKSGRIDQICYVYNIVQQELKGGEVKNADGKGERRTQDEVAEDLPK